MDSPPGLTPQSAHHLGGYLIDLCTTSGVGGVLIDADLVVVSTNRHALSLNGLPNLVPGKVLTGELGQICRRVIAAGAAAIEQRLPFGTDPVTTNATYHLTAMPLFDGIGTPTGAVVMLRPLAMPTVGNGKAQRLVEHRQTPLAEDEAGLTLALTAAKATTFHYDLSTRCLRYEDELSRTFGLTPGIPVSFEHALEHLVLPEDRPKVRQIFARLHAGELDTLNLEWRSHHPTLGLRTCASIGNIITQPDGQSRYLVGISIDITAAQKQQKEYRRLSEVASIKKAALELVFDTINAGIFHYDIDAKKTRPSASLRKLYALPAEPELIADEEWWGLLHIEDRKRVQQELKTAITAGQQTIASTFKITTATLGIRWISIRAQLTYDETGRAKAATGLSLDVTKQTEHEGFLSLALETLLGGHFDFSPLDQTGHTSPAVNDLIGVAQGPMVTDAQWRAAIHPDDRKWVADFYQQAARRQQNHLNRTYRIIHPERGERWIDDRRLQFFDNHGAHVRSTGIMFDITAQKQRERELLALIRTAEAAQFDAEYQAATLAIRDRQMRIAFDAARIAPFEYDIATRSFTAAAPPKEATTPKLKGKTSTLAEMLERIYPADRKLFEDAFTSFGPNSGMHISIEYRFVRRSGQLRWVLTRGQVIRPVSDSTGRLVGVSLDITEAKNRETDLAEARQRFYQAAEAARAAPFVHNLSNKTIVFDWDPSSGRTKEGGMTLSGSDALRIMHPEDQERLRHATDLAIEGRREAFSIDYAHPAISPGQGPRWFSMHAQPQYDEKGRAQRIVGLLLDITEKKQQEAAFQAQQDLLAKALEAAAVTVVSYDYETGLITFDHVPDMLRPFLPSYPHKGLISSVLKHVHPEDRPSIDAVLNHEQHGQRHQTVSIILRTRPEASPLWLALKGRIEHAASGSPSTFNGFLIDITRQRIAEVALIDASRLAMIGALATGVAHELRQPLNAIKLAAHNLERQPPGGLEAENTAVTKRLSLITRNVDRADRVISALRNLSRKPHGDKVWFDVADTLRELILLQSDVIREAGVALALDLEDGVRIYGEPHRLEQAVLNLMSNAIHAASQNRNESQPRLALSLAASREQGHLDVVVTDNGPGIDNGVLRNLFTPFMTTKPPAEGMGLGLSIVHSIVVQEFGGTVTAENTGSGALFRIRLQLSPIGSENGSGAKPRP